MEKTVFKFSLPYEEASQISAMRLYLRKRWFGSAGLKTLCILSAVMTAITISGPLVRGELTLALGLASLLTGVMLGLATCAFCYFWQRTSCARSVKKAMRQLGLIGAVCEFEMNDVGIKVTDRVMGGEFSWTEIHEWTENSEMLVIFRSDTLFYFFPLANMPPNANAWIKQNLTHAAARMI